MAGVTRVSGARSLPGTAGQPAASRPPVQVIVAAVMRPAGQDVPPPARVLRNPAMTPGVRAEGTRRVPIPTPAPGRVPPHSAAPACSPPGTPRSEEHTSELQSRENLVCRLLLEKKKKKKKKVYIKNNNRKKTNK